MRKQRDLLRGSNSAGDMVDSIERHGGSDEKKNILKRRYYNRYFEGYTEFIVPNRHGKHTHIERVYTDDYHTLDLSSRRVIGTKLLFTLLFLCSAVLFFQATLADCGPNYAVYSVFFQALGIGVYAWYFSCLYNKLTHGNRMTVYTFKVTHIHFADAALYTAACMGLILLADLIWLLFSRTDFRNVLIVCLRLLISGLGCLLAGRIEKQLPYTTLENDFEIPENAVQT